MQKLFKSTNEVQRQRGVEIGIRLGSSALIELHELLGHNRRDIRNSAAVALSEIRDPSSIPYLIGGLYGSAGRASNFRPAVDTAAQGLAKFSPEQRVEALKTLKYMIRPSQIVSILSGVPRNDAYEAALDLRKRNLILADWSESDLVIFISIDEERAWSEVQTLVGRQKDFQVQNLFPYLSPSRQLDLLIEVVGQDTTYKWYYSWIMDAVLRLDKNVEVRPSLISRLRNRILAETGKFDERNRLLRKLQENSGTDDASKLPAVS